MNAFELSMVLVKLIIGGMQFISFKALSQSAVEDISGKKAKFERPYFVATVLFGSVILSLIPFAYLRYTKKTSCRPSLRDLLRISVPGLSDACAQIMTLIGTKYLPVSLLMVLKGSRVVFSAMLSVIMLRRKLFPYQWVSVALCMTGLVVASLSSFISNFEAKSGLIIGIAMVLAAEAFRSVRMASEEQLLKKYKYNEFFIIGIEGVYGFIVSIVTLVVVNSISGSDNGSLESLENTIHMVDRSTIVVVILALLPIWINGMYLSGVFVTKLLSAVYNALITVLTVAVVWGLELILWYSTGHLYGAPWNNASYIQLAGFMIILLATLLYDRTLKIPALFNYPAPVAVAQESKVVLEPEIK